MKLTFIATHYLPHIGGLELATYHLANELSKQNNEIHIITPYPSSQNETKTNINVHRYPINTYPDENQLRVFLDGLIFFKKTLRTIKSINPDIVHAQNITNSIPAYIAWKKYHIPYIICIHGNLELMGPFLPKIFKKIWPHLPHIKSASQIVVLTNEMAERIETDIGRKPSVIPNGVDLTTFYPKSTPNKNEANPIIVTVSRIDDKKGLEYAILSMPQIIQKYPQTKLRIIGDGEYKSELEKIVVQNNLTESVEFTGVISNNEVPDYLRKADIFLLPSLTEGFSLTALEAIACGLPIISTNVGIVPYIISAWNNGYIIPFKSSEAIADAAKQLLSNPELCKIYAINSVRAAKETMSWEKVAKQYQTLYEQILTS